MNDQEFELCLLTLGLFDFKATVEGLRIRDTAQREALARVEAERDLAVSQRDGNLFAAQQMTEAAEAAQAQLAEAVALLQEIEQRMYGEDVEHRFTDLIADIDRITAQVEQQGYCERCGCSGEISEGCGPAGCSCRGEKEAQGAQAGDERAAFEKWAKDRSWFDPRPSTKERDDSLFCYEEAITDHNWIAWQARAALATQPVVPSQDAVTVALARRLLWIAYVWNDHNFDYAHREARREAEKHGITNLDEANAWLAGQPAVRGAEHE